MNFDLVTHLPNRIPGVLSGVPTLSQITPETADSVQNFNASLTDWKERAASWQQQTTFLTDVEWLMEHRADEVFQTAHELKVSQFELLRELIQINRQRAGLLDMMSIDLQGAETDATKKLETATAQAAKQLAKILPNTHPREKVLFEQSVKQSESVAQRRAKLRELRGHISAIANMKMPLADNNETLCELLTEAAKGLTE